MQAINYHKLLDCPYFLETSQHLFYGEIKSQDSDCLVVCATEQPKDKELV